MTSTVRIGLLLYSAAVVFFAVSATVAAHVNASGPVLAAGTALTAGAVLLILALITGQRHVPWGPLWPWVALGALEAINALLFYTAVRLAPTALVVALQLTSPMFLVLLGARHRRLTLRQLAAFAVMIIAVAIAFSAPSENTGDQYTLGILCALGSAACIAGLVLSVGRMARQGIPPLVGAGRQLMIAGVLLSPILLTDTGTVAGHAPAIAAIGAGMLAPAFAFMWPATRRLTPSVAGSMALLQPAVAAAAGWALYATLPAAAHILAGVCAVLAIALLLERDRPSPL